MSRCREPQTLRFSSAPTKLDAKITRVIEIRIPPSDRPTLLTLEYEGPLAAVDAVKVRRFQIGK